MASEKKPVRYTKDGKVDMRGRHAKPPQHRGNIDPELTKQIGAELLYWYVKPKAVTDEEIAERLTEYFQRTFGQGKLPTVEGADVWAGEAADSGRHVSCAWVFD